MTTLERTYTVPLRAGFQKSPAYYRTNRAVKTLREFMVRHMKASKDKILIGQALNDHLWRNGIKNPPARVTVLARKLDDGSVQVELVGKDYKGATKPAPRSEEPKGLKERLQAAVGKKDAKADAAEEPAAEAPKKVATKKAPAKKAAAKSE